MRICGIEQLLQTPYYLPLSPLKYPATKAHKFRMPEMHACFPRNPSTASHVIGLCSELIRSRVHNRVIVGADKRTDDVGNRSAQTPSVASQTSRSCHRLDDTGTLWGILPCYPFCAWAKRCSREDCEAFIYKNVVMLSLITYFLQCFTVTSFLSLALFIQSLHFPLWLGP